MKPRRPSVTYHSFQDLKLFRVQKSNPLPDRQPQTLTVPDPELDGPSERKTFIEAMEGVKPIFRGKGATRIFSKRPLPVAPAEDLAKREDAETLSQLKNLVQYGTGFKILDTPEYIEGTGYNVPRLVARRLHHGDFAIQGHIDLHALKSIEAKDVLERFLKWAVSTGKRGVLIIHGRGLSSLNGPVLKEKVIEWLTRGPWRKWVLAFSSARACDGGAGATYVLLRQRPVAKRTKLKPKKGSA